MSIVDIMRRHPGRVVFATVFIGGAIMIAPAVTSVTPGLKGLEGVAQRMQTPLTYAYAVGAIAVIIRFMTLPKLPDGECPKCGYDMGVKNLRCTECGWRRTL